MKKLMLVVMASCLLGLPGLAETVASLDTVPEASGHRNLLQRVIDSFDRIDENYIEPQHYLFTAMVQATYSYDYYTLQSAGADHQRVSFAPDGTLKAGPYFGWKWLFGGYTLALTHSDFSKNKTEYELSIYTSRIGADVFYRRTGVDYKLRNAQLGENIDAEALEGLSFDGVKAGITGANLYYIFNDRRFSYPAAFSQSTCQKISCGSWMAGIGYTKNTLDFDYQRLQNLLQERLAGQQVLLDSGFLFSSLRYHDISLTGGYAYNWVFAPRWLFCASGQVGLGYKKSTGNVSYSLTDSDFEHFAFDNVNMNLIGRFSIVFNNTRWYAGLSAIVRSNNYREQRFSTNNTYGSMNMYVGYNFGLKKRYRQQQ